jgi:hypothetical protein
MEILVKNYQDIDFLVMAVGPKRVGNNYVKGIVCLFVFLALQSTVAVFSQPASGL